MPSKGLARSISVSVPHLKRNSNGTKKRPNSDPGQKYNIGRSKARSRSSPKIPTPPPPPPPPPAKNLTYRPKSRTPSPKDALKLNTGMIYNKKINPIGFTFVKSGAPNGALQLYDIENDIEYKQNIKYPKKPNIEYVHDLNREDVVRIEKNNDKLREKYAKEHGITLYEKRGGSKTHRNKKPYKKTKRNNRRCVTRKYTGHKKRRGAK